MTLLFGIFIGIALTGAMLDNAGLALMAGLIVIAMHWFDKSLARLSDPVSQVPPRVPVINDAIPEECECMCSYSDFRLPVQISKPDSEI